MKTRHYNSYYNDLNEDRKVTYSEKFRVATPRNGCAYFSMH